MNSAPGAPLFLLSGNLRCCLPYVSSHLRLRLFPGSLFCFHWHISLDLHQCHVDLLITPFQWAWILVAQSPLTVSSIWVLAILGPLRFYRLIRINFSCPKRPLFWTDSVFENWYLWYWAFLPMSMVYLIHSLFIRYLGYFQGFAVKNTEFI